MSYETFREVFFMLVGYARVSTADQNLDLQKDALNKAGCEKVFEDYISGAVSARPQLEEALKYLRDNQDDTLVVWRLDRLGRSIRDLINLLNTLEERKIAFRSLQENLDTTSSGGKLIFHIFAALAEFERNLIRERTQAGLNAARARGRKGGRPLKLNDSKKKQVIELYSEKKRSIQELCELVGISKPTLYRYLKESHTEKSS